jgi:ABC-type glycerol-3-phosphate transport system permease component
VAVATAVAVSAAGAFWFLLHGGRLAKALRVLLVGTMALPPPVFIIPLFVILSDRGLTSNLVVLGVVYAAWSSGFGLYLLYTFYRGLPPELLEAARVDGASTLQLFLRVILPLSRPAIATLAALTFLWSWSDLLIAVVLVREPSSRTLTVAAALLSDQYATNTTRNAAGVLIALLPMLLAFLVAQRYIARGIVAGAGR